MALYLKGRPYVDYGDDVLNPKQDKAEVGNMNHPRKFPVNSLVKSRLKRFMLSKLPQPGHRPLLALSADD